MAARSGDGRAFLRPTRTGATTITTISLDHPGRGRRGARLPRLRRWLVADVHAALAIALAVSVFVGEAFDGFRGSTPVIGLSVAFVCLQIAIGLAIPGGTRGWRGIGRYLLAIAFVGALIVAVPRPDLTLPVLFIPIATLAAATSGRAAVIVAVAAILTSRLAIAVSSGAAASLGTNLFPAVVVAFLVVGTRSVVGALERSLDRLRQVSANNRRKARRLHALEELGHMLADTGSTPAALDEVMAVLVRTFGFHFTSLYLWTGSGLRLGAQRGHEHPIGDVDPMAGMIGRVAGTREAIFAPDVRADPEYRSANPDVVSNIAVPLLAGGDLLGVLSVESTADEPLTRDDLGSVRTIADRLAAAIALGAQRASLAERASLLGRLAKAFTRLAETLDRDELVAEVPHLAATVVRAEIGLLTLSDGEGGYRVAGSHGTDAVIGLRITPGSGVTGGAIATRAAITADRLEEYDPAGAAVASPTRPPVCVMAVPILLPDAVVGAITLVRTEADDRFTDQERETAALLAAQVGLAVRNSELHASAQEAAVRDPLTRLHNRRFLDATLERLGSQRARQPVAERRQLAAIMFDLDHFGACNKHHGHAVGDAVLRTFADILAGRFRKSDLVARYGGEEFLVVLEGASREDAVRAADEVRRRFRDREIPAPDGTALRMTVSAGCAELPPGAESLAGMLSVADVGLAMAKAGGRDQVVAA